MLAGECGRMKARQDIGLSFTYAIYAIYKKDDRTNCTKNEKDSQAPSNKDETISEVIYGSWQN